MNSESKLRLSRRAAGNLAARVDELPLSDVAEPRKGNIKLKMHTALTALIAGMAVGCKSLSDVEDFTDWLGGGARKLLRIWSRIPDTTLRDLVVKIDPDEIRKLIYRAIRQANRRKQLKQDFPLRVASMDGKVTSSRLWDRFDAVVKRGQIQGSRAMIRTITSCYVSTPARVCLDAHPIPPKTNEMGVFVAALDALLAAYEWLKLDVIMYDSGACGLANARAIVERGLDYVMCLKDNQPTLFTEAQRLLSSLSAANCLAETTDIDGTDVVVRRLFLTERMAGFLDWKHLVTVIRVQSEWTDTCTGEVRIDNRYYITSLASARLTAPQWLTLIRRRWSVENQNHNTFDTIFHEDQRPWVLDPQGMLVIMMVRRLTYNMLTLYRTVTLRSAKNRRQPWRQLIRTFYNALISLTVGGATGIRRRATVTD